MPESAWRIIDANLNRACEGLRVIEDFFRFELQDRFLTDRIKQLRHELARILVREHESLISSRDSLEDVGASIETDHEHHRKNSDELVIANFKRVQQALRTIEEYAKLSGSIPSRELESIRFEVYSLEKSAFHIRRGCGFFETPAIYALVDECSSLNDFKKFIRELVQSGVNVIQLRCRDVTDRVMIARARALVDICHSSPCLSIINNRPDLALLVGADGVHLGQDDMQIGYARRILKPRQLIGVSTHSLEQARNAAHQGADYIGIGPVFPSSTKEFENFIGVDCVESVVDATSLPSFAIGGIDQTNINKLVQSGCQRVALSHALSSSKDLQQTVAEIRALLSAPRNNRANVIN